MRRRWQFLRVDAEPSYCASDSFRKQRAKFENRLQRHGTMDFQLLRRLGSDEL
jgi:hypothetical protein